MSRYDDLLRHLQKLSLVIARANEIAEAKAVEIDAYLRRVAQSGVLPDRVILGRILYHAPYDKADCETGIVYQAAVHLHRGLGCIVWDTDEFTLWDEAGRPEQDGAIYFSPFRDCPPLARALLLPNINSLLERIVETLAHDPLQERG